MEHYFIHSLKKYGHLSENSEQELLNHIKQIYKNKGTFLSKKGQIDDNLYIAEKGIIRFYSVIADKERTNWFCTEGMTAFTSLSFFAGKPSNEYLELLEDSSIYYISKKALEKLYQRNVEIANIGRKIAEEYCLEFEHRVAVLHTQSAQEKYKTLITQTPEIIQRVSLGSIASYLGVTQETLSRIRRKVE